MRTHDNPDAADLSRYAPEPAQPVADPCDPYDDSETWSDYYRRKGERTGVVYEDVDRRAPEDRLCLDGQQLPEVEPEMFDDGLEPNDYR